MKKFIIALITLAIAIPATATMQSNWTLKECKAVRADKDAAVTEARLDNRTDSAHFTFALWEYWSQANCDDLYQEKINSLKAKNKKLKKKIKKLKK